jgi:hypothetical protein
MYAHKRTMYLLVLKMVLSHYLIAFTPWVILGLYQVDKVLLRRANFTYFYYTNVPMKKKTDTTSATNPIEP